MACSASDLVSLTPALNGIPLGLVPFAQLAVLCRILQNIDPMASCDAADLVDNAKCLSTCVPPGLVQYASLYLLCQIETGGGGGGVDGTSNMALAGLQPPVDGSVVTKRVFDTDTGFSWYNSGTIGAPTWNSV